MPTVYIKPGTGSGSGTLAAPYFYSELGTAETAAGSGGIIYFTDGDYSLAGTTTWDGVGSSGNNITYQSLNSKGAVIKSSASGTLRKLVIGSSGNTSTINVKNFKFSDIYFNILNQGAGEIGGNEIITSSAVGIPTGGFIAVTNSSPGTTKFVNNLVHFVYHSGNYFESYMGQLSSYSGNTIYVSNLSGKSSWYYSMDNMAGYSSITYQNNIFASDDTTGAVINTYASGSTQANNSCFFQFDDSLNGSGGTNNIFADPQFVDAPTGDLRLRPSSPCIGAGTAS
tara:strand:+ start:73 stop:921 length:849 start_codon:yes stop_codon:yes gene_type:complete